MQMPENRDIYKHAHMLSACEQVLRLLRQSQAPRIVRPDSAHLECLDGKFQIVHRTRRGSKVEDVIHGARHFDIARNVVGQSKRVCACPAKRFIAACSFKRAER